MNCLSSAINTTPFTVYPTGRPGCGEKALVTAVSAFCFCTAYQLLLTRDVPVLAHANQLQLSKLSCYLISSGNTASIKYLPLYL